MLLHNTSSLDTARLRSLFLAHAAGWPHDSLSVFVRHSRSTPFSGACHYAGERIYVNVGRHVRYPYAILTHVARARTTRDGWRRELYRVAAADAYQLALFVFLHEFYHWLVRRARRNTRQKESRCDRFAVRALVDSYGAVVRDARGRPVPRAAWDFQELDKFVARARRTVRTARPSCRRTGVAGSQRTLF